MVAPKKNYQIHLIFKIVHDRLGFAEVICNIQRLRAIGSGGQSILPSKMINYRFARGLIRVQPEVYKKQFLQ